MLSLPISLVATTAGLLVVAVPGFAGTPFLVGSDPLTSNFVAIDPSTGASTVIGRLREPGVTGLAFDTKRGILYGVSAVTDRLVTIDIESGQATVVGLLTTSPGVDMIMHGLAYNPDNDKLYGMNHALSGQQLYEIDRTTGLATFIGESSADLFGDIAYDSVTGTMYMSVLGMGMLHSIDLETGSSTAIGNFGLPVPYIGTGMAFHPDFGLIAASSQGDGLQNDLLFSINTTNGDATPIGPIGTFNISAITFVPTPAPFLIVSTGLFCIRRRRR